MILSSVVIALAFSAVADGRIYNRGVKIAYNFQYASFDSLMDRGFGFLEGGQVHFSMACDIPEPVGRPQLWLLLCSSADAREFYRMTSTQLNFDCHKQNGGLIEPASKQASYCQRQRVHYNTSLGHGQYSYTQEMAENAFYTLILLQCPSFDRELNFTMVVERYCESKLLALNPGNTELSSDEIPLPLLYTVINLIWAALTAAWFFNWVIYFKFSNKLHRLISCAPIFKVIQVALILLWWQELAQTGQESRDIASVKHFVQSIEDALLFITMVIIAEGWGVVRPQIKHYRWTSLLLLFVVFAMSLLCVYWVHRYFLAFSVCCVVFMMYKTLKWSSHNLDLLRRRRRKLRRFITRHNLRYKGGITLDTQLYQKLSIYQRFRIVCAAFCMVYAIAVTLSTFLHEHTYIGALTFEIPELLVYMCIGLIFRLRNFEPYEHIELVPPRENVSVIELPDVCVADMDPHFQLGVPLHFKVEKETQTPRRRWRAGMRGI